MSWRAVSCRKKKKAVPHFSALLPTSSFHVVHTGLLIVSKIVHKRICSLFVLHCKVGQLEHELCHLHGFARFLPEVFDSHAFVK